jgi:hypothetical protein
VAKPDVFKGLPDVVLSFRMGLAVPSPIAKVSLRTLGVPRPRSPVGCLAAVALTSTDAQIQG